MTAYEWPTTAPEDPATAQERPNVKRVRSAVKGIYGDDSSEYEMVGGTRKSERKRPVRKTEVAQA